LDAVGSLGLAVGTKALSDVNLTYEVVTWFSKFLRASYEMRRAEDWQRCLFAAADWQLGSPLNLCIPKSAVTADVRTALRARGLIDAGNIEEAQQDAAQTLNLALQNYPQDVHFERLSLFLAAVEWVTRKGWHAVSQSVGVPHLDAVDHIVNRQSQIPKERRTAKTRLRRHVKYQQIDRALRDISAARPRSHEEVFRFLDDRRVVLPNRRPFKNGMGWLKGFQLNPPTASVWLSQNWGRLGLPAFARGPKK
jgi:hypothetical protein